MTSCVQLGGVGSRAGFTLTRSFPKYFGAWSYENKILEGVIRRAESLGCQGCTPDNTIRLHYSLMGHTTPQTGLGSGWGPRLLHRWLRLHQSM